MTTEVNRLVIVGPDGEQLHVQGESDNQTSPPRWSVYGLGWDDFARVVKLLADVGEDDLKRQVVAPLHERARIWLSR